MRAGTPGHATTRPLPVNTAVTASLRVYVTLFWLGAQHNKVQYLAVEDGHLCLDALGHLDEGVVGFAVQKLDAQDVAVVGEQVEQLVVVHELRNRRTHEHGPSPR